VAQPMTPDVEDLPSPSAQPEANGNGYAPQPENGDFRYAPRALAVRHDEQSHALSAYVPAGPGLGTVEGTAPGLSFSQLMHSLRRRWLVATLVGLMIGLPAAAIVWLVTPNNFEVTSSLRIGMPRGWDGGLQMDPGTYDQYRRTQVALIRSDLVLSAALRKDGILDLGMLQAEKGTPKQFLSDEVFVVAPLGSELVQIKMRGKDPQQLVKVVNAVTDAYMENVVNAEHTDTLNVQQTLETQLKALNKELDQRLREQADAENQGGKNFDQQYAFLSQKLSALTGQITAKKMSLADLEGRIAIAEMREDKGTPVPEFLVERFMDAQTDIQELKKALLQYNAALQNAIAVSRNPLHDANVKSLQGQIDALKKQLDDRRAELRPQIVEQIKAGGQNPGETLNLDELKVQRSVLNKSLDAVQEESDKARTELSSLQRSNATLKRLEAEIRTLEGSRARLEDRLHGIEIDLKMPQRVVVYERATLPEGSTQLFRILITMFAGIIAFVAGAGTIVGMEYKAQRLNSSGELSNHTGLRVLGTVPNLAALSNTKNLNGSAALQGILAESVDSIRTMLLSQSRGDAPRVILVTSACDREGKTTVASHLAASLARSGRRTLLVDGDLRSPTVQEMFGAALNPGMCEILRGEVALEAGIQPTQVDGLMLLAAGQCDYQAIAALSQKHLNEILEKARQQFEFVVFDAAPVLTYGDTLLMGVHVDAAVLSARRDVSQLPKVYEAKERLELVGIRVLGAVVNGISETSRRPAFALPSPN
jgi:polysaccharide biosynthesis transport protein